MKPKEEEVSARCDMCIHCIYNDDNDTIECDSELDEDEMISFMQRKDFGCPYFQFNDEYKRVRAQN